MGNTLIDTGIKGTLYTVDSDGNQHEIDMSHASIEWTVPELSLTSQPSGQCVVTGIISGGNGISTLGTTVYPATCWSTIDTDRILEQAMEDHDASQYDKSDDGSIYFSQCGKLYISYNLPCNNSIQISVTDAGNANESCDAAMKVLEQMKEKIDEIQKKVFELSLSQQCQSDEN